MNPVGPAVPPSSSETKAPSPEQVLQAARECFDDGPPLRRWMQQNRPHICPFDQLIRFVPPQSRVLDVGCGEGLFLGLLARLGRQPQGVGFDSSAPSIQGATAMTKRIGASDQIRFLHIDARADWPEGTYDVVSMIDVLHHVPPVAQRQVIERAASKVRPGGVFIYKDIQGGVAGLMNRLHDLVIAREFIHYVPGPKVETWASGAGLQTVHAASIWLLWYPHLLRVFRRAG